MSKIKDYLKVLLPPHGWNALIAIVTVNIVVYYGTRLFTKNLNHYNFTSPLDRMIPFVPAFILVYICVAYAQWFFGYYLAARESKRTVILIFGTEIIAKSICMFFFFVLPTTMERAVVSDTDFLSRMVLLIYSMDRPDNLFPSIHCLESYVLWRTLPLMKKVPEWYRRITPFVSLAVFASVVLVKQHVVIDILGGVAVVEVGMIAMKCILKGRKKIKASKISSQISC